MEGRVVRICIAPVKALHVVSPDEVELTHAGVVGDRRFWLLDRDRRLVNGKRHPALMRVQPEWDEASRRLTLAFPDGSGNWATDDLLNLSTGSYLLRAANAQDENEVDGDYELVVP